MTNNSGLVFDKEQFNKLFPFYILINNNLLIEAMGQSLTIIYKDVSGEKFPDHFNVLRPSTQVGKAEDLQQLVNQLVVIDISNEKKTPLRGQIEYLQASDQYIFLGSPWFGSMEQVKEFNLSIHNFAFHDPLIDLLHVLKSWEITNEETKELLATVNRQKNNLKKATKEIEDYALFPKLNPDPLFRVSKDGTVMMKNPAAEKLFELEYNNHKYAINEFWLEISKQIGTEYQQWEVIGIEGEKTYSFVCRYFPELGYMNIYGRDVTLQKKQEQDLLTLSSVASANEHGVVITNLKGEIVWANEQFVRKTGFTESEIIGQTPVEIFMGPLTDRTTLKYLIEQFKRLESYDVELIHYRKDGTWFWGRSRAQPLKNKDGEIFQYFSMIEDITQKKLDQELLKASQEALRSNEEKYRSIITNMRQGLLEVDTNEVITFANQSFCEMSGYEMHELLGKNPRELVGLDMENGTLNEKKVLRSKGISDVYELCVQNKNKEKKWWLISGGPRYNDKQELVGSIGIHLDITEQKKLEEELIKARERAEHLAKTKEDFLANMSHEIRTPMNAIMGMSSQLNKTNLDQQQKFYLDTIHSAADNLLVIINDILDLSKIEAGKLTLESIGFQITTTVNRALQVLAHKAEEKGLVIKQTVDNKGISKILIGDPYRLNQVLLNLISNAIKFTEKGSVDLQVSLIREDEKTQLIGVSIIDTGIGMDQDFVDRVFDKFSQEYESVTRRYGGTGLGMSICKELIDKMGGSIGIKSIKGKGTTISFEIPFSKGSLKDLPEKIEFRNDSAIRGKTILITDDNDMNRLVASTILKYHGALTLEASSGQDAINELSETYVDLVLMDIQMPGINGLEATRILREQGYTLPIIALTANALKGENEKCVAAGMNDYISKPFKEQDLINMLAHWLDHKPEETIFNSLTAPDPESEKLYDLSTIIAISRDNDAFVHKMIRLFCDQSMVMAKQMISAYESGNYTEMGAVAHKLKPSIDNMNISSLKTIIREVESFGKANYGDSALPELLLTIEKTLDIVTQELNLKYP